ncbi:MAG: hypothetical protein KDE05_11415 [Parvularculaceae bacterium]|nr:hypothetical protein [Parvularculaceae bacterium]
MRSVFAAIILVTLSVQSAQAATTVFASGVYSQSGAVSNLANAFGAPDGGAASIGGGFSFLGIPIGTAGQAVYSFANPLSGANIQLTALGGAGAPPVRVSIGEIVSGVAVFSTELAFTGGVAGLILLDLSTQCALISSTGCSLLRIRTIGGFGGGAFLLDGVSGVGAAPEPAVWGLMLLGFGASAWRLKRARGAAAGRPAIV